MIGYFSTTEKLSIYYFLLYCTLIIVFDQKKEPKKKISLSSHLSIGHFNDANISHGNAVRITNNKHAPYFLVAYQFTCTLNY